MNVPVFLRNLFGKSLKAMKKAAVLARRYDHIARKAISIYASKS
jgi:hypothetical protein